MKKSIKKLALLLVLALLCLTLTGCEALDEARATQAFWTAEKNIAWANTEYLLLPECKEFEPQRDYGISSLYVTDPDVPVLLKEVFGEYLYACEGGLFLGNHAGAYYCRADRYAEFSGRLEAGFVPEGYCYAYYDYSVDSTKESPLKYYKLLDLEVQAVEQALTQVEPTILPSNTSVHFDDSVALELCSADLLLRRYVVELCLTDGTYYFVEYDEKGNTVLYTIPEALSPTFAAIFSVKKYK